MITAVLLILGASCILTVSLLGVGIHPVIGFPLSVVLVVGILVGIGIKNNWVTIERGETAGDAQ